MDSQPDENVDFVKELRLRRWARENYVRPENRVSSWHPVVLNEMRNKDAELQMVQQHNHDIRAAYVPLAPVSDRIVHEAHLETKEPNWVHVGTNVKAQTPST